MTMTGTIFDIKRYAIHDGPGIRTTIFFKGCPLDCWWCHNPEGKLTRPQIATSRDNDREEMVGREIGVTEVMEEVLKDTIFYEESDGGVTFSGGEPMMQIKFLNALLEACRKRGLHTIVDTCGQAPYEDFQKINDLVDIYFYDLKLIDDQAHIKYTGVSNELILQNLTQLASDHAGIIIRIPLIPGITDTEANLKSIANFTGNLKTIKEISLLPYNKMGENKFKKFAMPDKIGSLKIQTKDEVGKIADRFRNAGFNVKIGG